MAPLTNFWNGLRSQLILSLSKEDRFLFQDQFLNKTFMRSTRKHSSLPSEPVLTTTCFIFSKVSILRAEFGFFNAVEMSSLRLTVIKRAGPVCGGVLGFVLDRIRVR